MPTGWNTLNELLAGNGLVFQYLTYSLAGVALLLFLSSKSFLNSAQHLTVTGAFIAAFAVMFYLEKNPGEKIHMLQYGLLGWLLYKALALHFSAMSIKLYLTGSVIVLAAGTLDELIQAVLPNRYFTLHDVFINALSGIMVQLYIWYYLIQQSARTETSDNRPLRAPEP